MTWADVHRGWRRSLSLSAAAFAGISGGRSLGVAVNLLLLLLVVVMMVAVVMVMLQG